MGTEYCIRHWSTSGQEKMTINKIRYYQTKERMLRELPAVLEWEYHNWKFKVEAMEREVGEWKESK